MTTIYLLRHAEYANPRHILPGRLPVELSEAGQTQAKKLKTYFADKKIEKIFSSAVLRCKQTSEIISNNKIPIEYDKRLLEVLTAYQGYWEENYDLYYTMRPTLGGETNQDVQNRIIDFWKTTKFEDGKNFLICSHGDPLFFLFQYLAHIPLTPEENFIKHLNDIENYQPIGAIHVIEKENGKWIVKKLIKPEDL